MESSWPGAGRLERRWMHVSLMIPPCAGSGSSPPLVKARRSCTALASPMEISAGGTPRSLLLRLSAPDWKKGSPLALHGTGLYIGRGRVTGSLGFLPAPPAPCLLRTLGPRRAKRIGAMHICDSNRSRLTSRLPRPDSLHRGPDPEDPLVHVREKPTMAKANACMRVKVPAEESVSFSHFVTGRPIHGGAVVTAREFERS